MRMLLACLSFVVFAPLATAQNLTAPPNVGGAGVVPDIRIRQESHALTSVLTLSPILSIRTCMIMLSAQLIVVLSGLRSRSITTRRNSTHRWKSLGGPLRKRFSK
jgi:hypothetical protein